MKDKVAIVILNWNGVAMMRKYLPTVIKYSEGATVYIADNASTDDSVDFIKSEYPMCPLVVLEKNWGFAEGYNKALSKIDAEYYLLLNSDIEVTEGWLNPLVNFMDSNPDVAACQPKLLSIYNRNCFEYAGASGGYLDKYGYPFCRGRIFETVEEDRGQYDNVSDVLWATGAALMVRSSDYKAVGGLDGRFFAHNEEIDMCWRLRIMGRRVCCVTDSVVYHVGGGTLPKSNPMKTYLNFRNNLTMLYKCLPDNELESVMRMRCLLDYVAALQMLILKRNVGEFKAVIRGRKDFNKWKNDFDKDRERIQKSKKNDVVPERMNLFLLWRYYVKGQRTFCQLQKG